MGNIVFKLDILPETRDQMTRGVKIWGSRIMGYVIMANGMNIGNEINAMLATTLENSDVIKSLRGKGTEDLPAHLGLSDMRANALANGIIELIQTGMTIEQRSENDIISIRINAVQKNWEEYLKIPGAEYISHPSNIIIPVVKWLLIDPGIDIGQAAYDIVFEGEDKHYDVRIQQASRSGRAIMVALKALGGGSGYVLPDIISGHMGENFIEYTLCQSSVIDKIAKIIMKRVQ